MRRFKSILCASVLTLAISSSAVAGNSSGKSGNISGKTSNVAGNISGRTISSPPVILDEIIETILGVIGMMR